MITLPVSPSAPPAGLRLEGCTALVAEEEPVQALDLRRTLADLGCAVLGPVASGTEAVRLVRQRRPDLALLDLPLRDGGALRAAEALVLRQVPFALLTTGGELDLLGHPLLRAAADEALPLGGAVALGAGTPPGRSPGAARRGRAAPGGRAGAAGPPAPPDAAPGGGRPRGGLGPAAAARGIARSFRLMRAHRAYLRRQLAAE
jgi:two-component system, response regulator PdtaR